jgi:PAS domain S-box-containing protein
MNRPPEEQEHKLHATLPESVAGAEKLEQMLSTIRATAEATTDGIVVTDEAGRITLWNETFRRLWAFPPGVLEARDHRRALEWMSTRFEGPEQFLEQVGQIERDGPTETITRLTLADGNVFERLSRVHHVGGRPAGRVWSYRDIGERERAHHEHAYLAAIVSSSNDAIVSKTLDGVITSWNSAAERMFGYTSQEAVGSSITIIIPPERRDEEVRILERLRRGERIEHFETIRLTKDGRPITVSITISPVRDEEGRIIGASKVARDVSERAALLAREQAARARAEEASRLKDEFLATVSHELRAPLNAILGWAQILRAGALDEERVRHAITVVERNARTQAQVIEDLLDVSRIITGKLRLDIQPIAPARAVASAIESVKPMAEAKGVQLHVDLDPEAGPILGDSSRIQQIVWNLLTNAIKFTPSGGSVSVTLQRVGSQVELGVRDTGIGIAPEFLPHVFDRFRQADASTTRAVGGLGLGLAIVRHLVELHGGTVRAESAGPNQGSMFLLRLPLRPGVLEGEERTAGGRGRVPFMAPEEVPNLVGVRVLVVDDEADARELLREVLVGCGAEVREASTAAQALREVGEWRPAVIVSDIGLPGEDGYDLIRKVREWEQKSGTWTPAIALTGYARTKDRMRALMAGYQMHVAKPIEPVEFALVVSGVLQQPAAFPEPMPPAPQAAGEPS